MNNPQTLSEQLAQAITVKIKNRGDDFICRNSLFELILKELQSIGLDRKFDKHHNAEEAYKKKIRKRYEKQADSIKDLYPNGVFTITNSDNYVGIDITLRKAIREMLECERLKKRWWQIWKD